MKTAILVGGKGTRLFAEQTDMPKALYEIGNRPILWHIMKMYEAHGFREFLLLLGYKAEKIVDYVLHRQPFEGRDMKVTLATSQSPAVIDPEREQPPWTISLCHTGLESPKGERIRRVEEYVADDENLMVTYGDGLSDIDIGDLVQFHRDHGKVATITAVRADSQFGHLHLDESTVTAMIENPQLPDWINGGFMVFRREIFDWLEPDDPLETGALRRLAEAGELMAYRHSGFWACMDTYKDNLELNELWDASQAPWKKW